MSCFASSADLVRSAAVRARLPSLGLQLLLLVGCSDTRLSLADAQRLVESSARFSAPNVLTIRPQYCATVEAPGENVTAGGGQLKAVEGAGAIRVGGRGAAPGECTSQPGPIRERLVIALADGSATFHPRARESGWEFTLARRHFVSMGEMTFNSAGAPTIAHAVYRWAWRAELLGQLMQLSEEPVNAQATFIKQGSAWIIRDVGF